jgi:Flp pilus assembly protein TadD
VQSGRYHLWRIGFREVADHPLTGVGADNFAVDLARRDSGESLLYPHSSVLRAFSQTGLVGGALFVGFVAVALAAAVRKRRMDPRGSAIVATSCAAFVYWLVHSAVDWLWEIPAVTAPAFALLGLAVAMRKPEGRTLRPNRLSRSVLLVGVALAGASCALPALAAVEVERAAAEGKNDPQRAFARLDRARSLNALSERPDVVEAVLALRLGDTVRARSALTRAAARSPDDWWVHAELALLDAHAGRVVDARAQLRRADVLAPESPVLRLVRAALRSRGPSSSKALAGLDARAIRSPLGRRAIECRPLLGLAGRCTVERGDG